MENRNIISFVVCFLNGVILRNNVVISGKTWKQYMPIEVWISQITKSSYETELRKMPSHFELLTPKFLWKFFFRVANSTSWNIKLNFQLLTRRFIFYFSTSELLTWKWKIKSFTSSY